MKLTPQEKKRLSYERDRRNEYGENDKSSRKAIPFRKRLAARRVRHAANQYLAPGLITSSDGELERAEGKIKAESRKAFSSWRKTPDVPLGEYLARKPLRRRNWHWDSSKDNSERGEGERRDDPG